MRDRRAPGGIAWMRCLPCETAMACAPAEPAALQGGRPEPASTTPAGVNRRRGAMEHRNSAGAHGNTPLSVRAPFHLEATVRVLQRRPANRTDIWEQGRYLRVFPTAGG